MLVFLRSVVWTSWLHIPAVYQPKARSLSALKPLLQACPVVSGLSCTFYRRLQNGVGKPRAPPAPAARSCPGHSQAHQSTPNMMALIPQIGGVWAITLGTLEVQVGIKGI